MWGKFSIVVGLHAQLGDVTLLILCSNSRVKYTPQYIQLTTVACFTCSELSPACCQTRIGVVVDSESRSTYSEEVLGSASDLSLLSQRSETAVRQCILHLSDLHGNSKYCRGSGSPYSRAVLLAMADQPANLSSKNAKLCLIEILTFWLVSSHCPNCPRSPRISRSLWAVAGRTPIERYTSGLEGRDSLSQNYKINSLFPWV